MDFDTRDRYRHAVEQLAEQSRLAEWEVAERALRQCHSSENSPSGHVGYWLIDEGRAFFSDAIDPRPWTLGLMLRRIRRYPGVLYACALLPAGLTAFAVPAAYPASAVASIGSWLLGTALTTPPASILYPTLVKWPR